MKKYKLAKTQSDRLLSMAVYLKDGGKINPEKLQQQYIKTFSDIEENSALRKFKRDMAILEKYKLV